MVRFNENLLRQNSEVGLSVEARFRIEKFLETDDTF